MLMIAVPVDSGFLPMTWKNPSTPALSRITGLVRFVNFNLIALRFSLRILIIPSIEVPN